MPWPALKVIPSVRGVERKGRGRTCVLNLQLQIVSCKFIADMISKGEIGIKPDTKVLYNCWMHEITKYPNLERGI